MRELTTEQATAAFWDSHPCDGQASYAARAAVRARKHPWLIGELEKIAARHTRVVEIGCGQGTDCFSICSKMPNGGSYIALDRSPGSIRSARSSLRGVSLNVTPTFVVGDAMQVPFADDTVECIYSMGVLHHASDTGRGVEELHRVMSPAGVAHVALYRSNAVKVAAALLLRRIQSAIGVSFLPLAAMLGENTGLGTMVHECFGVPVLRAYSRREIEILFSRFSGVKIEQRKEFWLVRAVK